MKKILTALFLLIYAFTFFTFFNDKNATEYMNFYNIENNLHNNYEILLPASVDKDTKKDVFDKLTKVLDEYKGNVIFKRSDDKKSIKYVYLNDFSYFNNYSLSKGRFFNKDDLNKENIFISSMDTNNSNQIGKINEFAGDDNFEIRTLFDMSNDKTLSLSGYCTVQLPENNIEDFIKSLKKEMNIKGEIQIREKTEENLSNNIQTNNLVLYVLYFVLILLIVYEVLGSYKKIGIKKLLGYSDKDIWLERIWEVFKVQIICISIVTIGMSLYLFKAFNLFALDFLVELFFYYGKKLTLILFLSSLPYIYIITIQVSNMIKNKRNTKEIIIFNTIIKWVLMVVIICLSLNIISNYSRIKNVFSNSFKQWEQAGNYECISGCDIPGDIYFSEKTTEKLKKLYCILNEKGAIMADFSQYTDAFRNVNPVEKGMEYEIDSAVVNPNYLKINSVKDENGNNVTISENEEDKVLLISNIYKDKENEITEYYKKIYNGYKSDVLNKNDRNIKIIWIEKNQKLFSYNIEVNTKEDNMVESPILQVLTENNSIDTEYSLVINFTGSPFKILKDDSYDLLSTVKEIIDVGQYEYTITSADEQISAEIKQVNELLKYNLQGIGIVLIGVLIIIIQNNYNYFEQYKRSIFIKYVHGYSFYNKYKKSLLLIIIGQCICCVSSIFIIKENIKEITIICLAILLFELIIWLITLKILEKRKIISIIKGC